jgi:predicted nucleic-acid-binding Zn-ribbon protein
MNARRGAARVPSGVGSEMAKVPGVIEPEKEYLGVVCRNCAYSFPIVGPLDPAQVPPDKAIRVGARGPLHGTCPHCGHRANYPIEQIQRIRAP